MYLAGEFGDPGGAAGALIRRFPGILGAPDGPGAVAGAAALRDLADPGDLPVERVERALPRAAAVGAAGRLGHAHSRRIGWWTRALAGRPGPGGNGHPRAHRTRARPPRTMSQGPNPGCRFWAGAQ